MKDLCDEAWDELYGGEYGYSDKCPCEPHYSLFCSGWEKCEERFQKCSNCSHYHNDLKLCQFSMGDKDHWCRGRNWEVKE
jgi:hypothetical protein